MGIYEDIGSRMGTNQLIDILANITSTGTYTFICGRNTVNAVENKGLIQFSHISSGRSMALEMLLFGKELPGVKALLNLVSRIEA